MNTDMSTRGDALLEGLCDRIRRAAAERTPLRLRGGGSKDFYGHRLQGEVVDTTAASGIVSYEPSELVVTARAGTPLALLESTLAAQGQYLPFEPPHYRWSGAPQSATSGGMSAATVGGMVACGLSGPARASVGSVRDHVLGVTMLNGRAEHLTFGGQVIKNVAGYDLSRVMVGAMGTLGLLLDISIKVLPLPPAEATLVFELDQAQALAHLHRWGGQPLPLNASCWVNDSGRECLFLRLRGAAAAVEAACERLLREAPASAAARRMDNAQAAADWALCRDQQLPFFTRPPTPGLALWRLSVPQTTAVLDLPWPQLVEWHGGQRWLWAPLSEAARLREAASRSGGSATVFVADTAGGISATAQFDAFSALTPPLERIHRQLKAEFDPSGVFNRGRMYDSF